MRSILCVSVVCLFASTAVAQFSKTGAAARAERPADTTPRKTPTEKGRPEHPGKVPAGDQAAAETELANALLAAMDADGDGVVTKIELNKAMAALRKVHKDTKGNMMVPDKAAADPNAAAATGPDPNQAGPAGQPPAGGRGNEAMARFMEYDRNHDGRLTVDEVPAQGRQMLQGADLNNDGAIDASELQAFSRRMGDRMKAWAAGVNPNGAAGVPGDGRAPKP